jgi:hypothetical protein
MTIMTSSANYDQQFSRIGHFQLYLELYPWVGQAFHGQSPRIPVVRVGESHYLKPDRLLDLHGCPRRDANWLALNVCRGTATFFHTSCG